MANSRGLTFVFIGLAVCGCKSGPVEHLADAAPPKLQAGWTTASDAASGVSIGVPGGWQQGAGPLFDAQQAMSSTAGMVGTDNSSGSSGAAQMLAGLQQAQLKDAQAQEDAEMDRLRKNGILINVIDSSRTTIAEARTRFYVKKKPYGGSVSLQTASDDEKSTYLQPGLGTDVVLPVGKAHRFEKQLQLQDGDQQMKISYVLVDGGDAYLIRFISTNTPDVFKPIEQGVVESFRLKKK